MKKTITICDICQKEEATTKDMQVIFTPRQREERSVKPYLSMVTLDICETCLNHTTTSGKYIKASDAMGYSEYQLL